ncbi:DUF362 domain-containing protein [Patescibacteria group bacterium]
MAKVYLKGIPANSERAKLKSGIKQICLEATEDLSWLKPGENVLLKPALNSSDPYPSTTNPLSLEAVAELIEDRGGKVIIGDQSGIEHVVQDETGVLRGDTAEIFNQSGMGGKRSWDFQAFEKGDWKQGFVKYGDAPSWPDGFYFAKPVAQADHIINLPRLSTHGQAGVTLGFKNMVGILREDSRAIFHSNGPFHSFFKRAAKGSHVKNLHDKQKKFFEKIVEISLATQSKLRLTLFTGTKAQLTFGPDKYISRRGGKGFLRAYQSIPKTGLVFASSDQVAAEAMAIAFMIHLYSHVPFGAKLWQKLLIFFNGQINELGQESVRENPFVKYAIKAGLGSSDMQIKDFDVPHDLLSSLEYKIKKNANNFI